MSQTNYKYSDEDVKKWFLNTVSWINGFSGSLIDFFNKKILIKDIFIRLASWVLFITSVPRIKDSIHTNSIFHIGYFLVLLILIFALSATEQTNFKKFIILDYLKDWKKLDNIDYSSIQKIYDLAYNRFLRLITINFIVVLLKLLLSLGMIIVFVIALIVTIVYPSINTILITIASAILFYFLILWYSRSLINTDYLTFIFLDNYKLSNFEILKITEKIWLPKNLKKSYSAIGNPEFSLYCIPDELLKLFDFTKFDEKFSKEDSDIIKDIIKLSYLYETYKQQAIEKWFEVNNHSYEYFNTK